MKEITSRIGLVCCSLMILLRAEAQISKGLITMGGSGSQAGNSIIQTTDGGYAIAGYTNSYGAGGTDVYVVKLDKSGNKQWAKTIGGADSDAANSIVQANDGGYVIAGGTNSFGAGQDDIYVIKLDASGNLVWTKTIGGSLEEYGEAVAKTYDGGYAIAGYTNSFGAGGYDIYVVKLDSVGNLLWTRTVGTPANDQAYSIVQTYDKGLAIAGYTMNFYSSQLSYVVKLDSAGNLLWTRVPRPIGGSNSHWASSIAQSADSGLVIAGTGTFGIMANSSPMVDKLSSSGGVLWAEHLILGGFGGASCIASSKSDDAAVISAASFSISLPKSYFWTLKVDSAGAIVWGDSLETASLNGRGIISTSDKGIAIAGSDSTKILFMKFDSTGKTCISDSAGGGAAMLSGHDSAGGVTGSGGSEGSGGTVDTGFSRNMLCGQFESGINSLVKTTPAISVFPNPSNGEFTFEMKNEELIAKNIDVYNVLGEKVYSQFLIPHSSFLIDLSRSALRHLPLQGYCQQWRTYWRRKIDDTEIA